MSYEGWKNKLRSDLDAVEKQAAALKATDPADNGKMDVPSYNTESVRSNMNLPKNPTSNTVQDKDGTHGLCTVTKPNAVGEGEYPTAIDGNARDEAFKTPSTPLSKIAGDVLGTTNASDTFEIPADLRSDASIMQKLAFCGNLVLGDEKGQRMVAEIMAKEAGRQEAQAILESVYNDLYKEAAMQAELEKQAGLLDKLKNLAYTTGDKISGMASATGDKISDLAHSAGDLAAGSTNIGGHDIPNWLLGTLGLTGATGLGVGAYNMLAGGNDEEGDEKQKIKTASVHEQNCTASHSAWLNALETDFEKRAYMQGAVDAAAADQAAADPAMAEAMGGEIPANDSDITDEEVMQVIQSMVQSGELAPEQVDALMQQIANDEAPSYTAE